MKIKKLFIPAIFSSAFLISIAHANLPTVRIGNNIDCDSSSYCITVLEGPNNNNNTINYGGDLIETFSDGPFDIPLNGHFTKNTPLKVIISPDDDGIISNVKELDFHLTTINGASTNNCKISINRPLHPGGSVLEVNYDKASNSYNCISLVK